MTPLSCSLKPVLSLKTIPKAQLQRHSLQGFQAEFAWQGTSDVSAWLAVPTALRLQQALGVERCRRHNHSKLQEAVALLQAAWGTQLAVLGVSLHTSRPFSSKSYTYTHFC